MSNVITSIAFALGPRKTAENPGRNLVYNIHKDPLRTLQGTRYISLRKASLPRLPVRGAVGN